jgi:hypothetical protein
VVDAIDGYGADAANHEKLYLKGKMIPGYKPISQ